MIQESGDSGNSSVPPRLATSGVGSSEPGPGMGTGAIVYEDPNEQDGSDPITLTGSQSTLLESERIARVLELIRMEMMSSHDEAISEEQRITAAAEGVMLAAMLSWLTVLLRGGSLAALAISSLPIWRGVDPLAVLVLSKEERERLEEDLRKARELEDAQEEAVGRLLDAG